MEDEFGDFDGYLERKEAQGRQEVLARRAAPSRYQGMLEAGLRRRQEEKDELQDQLNRKRVKREVCETLETKVYVTRGYKDFLENRGKKVEEETVDFVKFWGNAGREETSEDRQATTQQLQAAIEARQTVQPPVSPPPQTQTPDTPPADLPPAPAKPLTREEKLQAAKAKLLERKKTKKESQ